MNYMVVLLVSWRLFFSHHVHTIYGVIKLKQTEKAAGTPLKSTQELHNVPCLHEGANSSLP